MTNWWDAAPIAKQGTSDWWSDAPPVAPAAPAQTATPAQSMLRGAQSSMAGIADAAGNLIGGIPDLAAAGLRMVHPSLAPAESDYYRSGATDLLRQATGTADFVPQGNVEEIGYGAGRGAADALAFLAPGTALSRLGGVAGGVGKAMTAAPATQVAAGSVAGATTEATDSPVAGLVAGMAVPAGAAAMGRLTTPFPARLSQQAADNVARAQQYGVPLTPAQSTGSKLLANVERSFDKSPFVGEAGREAMQRQAKGFNRAVMGTIGSTADDVTPQAVDDAAQAIGRQYDDLIARTTIKPDNQLFQDLDAVGRDYLRRLPTNIRPVVQSYLDDLNQMRGPLSAGQDPQMAGEVYQRVVSGLKRSIRGQSDPDTKHALQQVLNAVKGNLERSAGKEIADGFRQADTQWRNLLAIEKTMAGPAYAQAKAQGDLPYKAFAGVASKASGFRGKDDLAELGRLSQFLADAPSQNRAGGIGSAMVGNLGPAAAGGTIGAYLGGPIGAPVGMAAGALAHNAAAQLYNTPAFQRYLMKQGRHQQGLAARLLANVAAAQTAGQTRDKR